MLLSIEGEFTIKWEAPLREGPLRDFKLLAIDFN